MLLLPIKIIVLIQTEIYVQTATYKYSEHFNFAQILNGVVNVQSLSQLS